MTSHPATRIAVMTEETQGKAVLSRTPPILMVAKVSPALGKMKAQEARVNLICLQPRTMLGVVRSKNQNASSHKQTLVTAPTTLTVSAADRKW